MQTIVLVDDVPIANFIMMKLLKSIVPEAAIHDFTSSVTALDNIATLNPDLIFLDLNMPDMDGFQFLDAMKERNLKHKVVIISSSTSEIDKNRAATYKNVKGYYIKPMEKEPLQQLLKP